MRSLVPIVLLAALAACRTAPEPTGERFRAQHCLVVTDSSDPDLARGVAKATDEVHSELVTSYFGAPPSRDQLEVVVCTKRETFDAQADTGGARDPAAVQGRFADGRIVVFWPDEASGRRALAHELVHAFADELALESWQKEGLAAALSVAPGTTPEDANHPNQARRLGRDEIKARLAALPSKRFLEDAKFFENAKDHDSVDVTLAAALVRYGLETGNWKDVRALATWKPDLDAFLTWVLGARSDFKFEHFPPLDAR